MNKTHQYFKNINKLREYDLLSLFFIVYAKYKASVLINFVPLRFYFNRYFIQKEKYLIDLEPYNKDILFVKKVLNALPGKATCLKECIVVHLYLKKKGIIVPIHLGILNEGRLHAHAWIDHSNAAGFKKINVLYEEEFNCQKNMD